MRTAEIDYFTAQRAEHRREYAKAAELYAKCARIYAEVEKEVPAETYPNTKRDIGEAAHTCEAAAERCKKEVGG